MSTHSHFRFKLLVIALTLCYSGLSKADNNVLFPLYPRLNLYGGTGDTSYGRADVMAPLFGSTQAIVYTDVDGQIGENDSWLGSLGLGTRDAINNDFMLGGYVFADRFNSGDDNGGNIWMVFNPGVEFMTNHWDGRINGYFPSGDHKKFIGTFFGDQVNQSGAITHSGHQEFIGHDQFNLLFDKIEEIGPGADIDAGYTFTSLKRLRVNAGTYYFSIPDSSDINGVEAGVEMPINNHLLLQFNDSYDNVQKNTAVVSVRFTLGGMDKYCPTPTVQDRMLDPIYRHLGSLGTNTASPINTRTINTHRIALERNNIWFFNANSGAAFDPSAGDNNCTFEHPCIGTSFNQNNIGTINNFAPRANFYFAPGTYSFSTPSTNSSTIDAIGDRLSLYSGQSMYGRTNDYSMPASAASGFPTFIGGLDLQGNNILDSFALINNGRGPRFRENFGIQAINANNILMNNLHIGQMNPSRSYARSIKLSNAQNITIQNSTIQSLTDSTTAAILTTSNSNVTFNNNISTLINGNIENRVIIFGIDNRTLGAGTVIHSNNNIFNLSGSAVTGIASNDGTVTATGNTFNITASSDRSDDGARGARNGQEGTMTLTNNTFNIHNENEGNSTGVNNGGTLILTGNTFNLQSDNSNTVGLTNGRHDTINLNNNTFSLTSNAHNNIGISNDTLNSSSAITGSNNTFTLTGTGMNVAGRNIGDFFTNPTNNNNCTINGNLC